ncbi:hypothetical protein BKA82DRAFT_1007712 [Pisolithus tinctorius]|nr:hypothetical protein BKA82DRAFT_1007712 [Pisolithus tinctorius]
MRLIDVKAFLNFHSGTINQDTKLLVDVNGANLEETPYAILKMDDDTARERIRQRSGYQKIYKSCERALLHDELSWLWVDTCCINKQSSAELSEAINSMYVWYANSDHCYAFLHDIDARTLPSKRDDKYSHHNGWPKWFSRGWTLQELIAPDNVHFFNQNWEYIGSKQGDADTLELITKISVDVLRKGLRQSDDTHPSVAQIMSWAANRRTTRDEDQAYSLLGLLGVHMPMLYGEGKNAFLRLQLEVIRTINDQSIFAWGWTLTDGSGWAPSFLADEPSRFRDCSKINRMTHKALIDALKKHFPKNKVHKMAPREHFKTFDVTNEGILISLFLQRDSSGVSELFSAMLACCDTQDGSSPITITLRQSGPDSNYSRYFRRRMVSEWNANVPIKMEKVFLPYRDNIDFNIRGPLSRPSRLARIPFMNIRPSDIIILVLGASGSGKSNIINKLTRVSPEHDKHSLAASMTDCSAYTCVRKGKRFIFIDTPAFDMHGFERISNLMNFIYQGSMKLTGLIYTHNIMVECSCAGEQCKSQILKSMCGDKAIDRLRLVTTMWDGVQDPEYAIRVEDVLKRNCWKALLQEGATSQWFVNTPQSAWAIVESLGDTRKPLLLQEEMVKGINLRETTAFKGFSFLQK